MTEVKITYETLFDILRRERNRDEIQALDDSFYQDVLEYMAQKQKLLDELGTTVESEKARVQFQNIKKILSELYDRREKKIVLLALNVVRTGVQMADKESLLQEERLLFEELVALFGRYRLEVLESVLRQASPFGGVQREAGPKTPSEPKKAPEAAIEPKKESESISQSPKKPSEDATASPEGVGVKFLKAVPRFAGGDGEVFGPFSAGDSAKLPEQIANVLLKKNRVEKI